MHDWSDSTPQSLILCYYIANNVQFNIKTYTAHS